MVFSSKLGKIYGIARYDPKHIVIGGSKEIIDILRPKTKLKTLWAEGTLMSNQSWELDPRDQRHANGFIH